MKVTVENEKYGTIEYNENFWTGKKEIYVDGKLFLKKSKDKYVYQKDEKELVVRIKGNYLSGVNLNVIDTYVEIIPKTTAIEYILAILPLIFVIVWGNSPYLCSIFPVVGGAIGGGIAGLSGALGILFMKKTKSLIKKILVGLVAFAIAVLICFIVAVSILSALA